MPILPVSPSLSNSETTHTALVQAREHLDTLHCALDEAREVLLLCSMRWQAAQRHP